MNQTPSPLARQEQPRRHYLYPGGIFVHHEPCLVTTVLGSCVSVCLWDCSARVGGINHYLLPLWNGEGLPTPKYGNIAIVKLIEKVLAFPGTKRGNLVAKVFGGASMWDKGESLLSVGDRNIELAMDLLEKQGLPILARDLGGRAGRKLIFNTADGSVLMRRQRVIPGVK